MPTKTISLAEYNLLSELIQTRNPIVVLKLKELVANKINLNQVPENTLLTPIIILLAKYYPSPILYLLNANHTEIDLDIYHQEESINKHLLLYIIETKDLIEDKTQQKVILELVLNKMRLTSAARVIEEISTSNKVNAEIIQSMLDSMYNPTTKTPISLSKIQFDPNKFKPGSYVKNDGRSGIILSIFDNVNKARVHFNKCRPNKTLNEWQTIPMSELEPLPRDGLIKGEEKIYTDPESDIVYFKSSYGLIWEQATLPKYEAKLVTETKDIISKDAPKLLFSEKFVASKTKSLTASAKSQRQFIKKQKTTSKKKSLSMKELNEELNYLLCLDKQQFSYQTAFQPKVLQAVESIFINIRKISNCIFSAEPITLGPLQLVQEGLKNIVKMLDRKISIEEVYFEYAKYFDPKISDQKDLRITITMLSYINDIFSEYLNLFFAIKNEETDYQETDKLAIDDKEAHALVKEIAALVVPHTNNVQLLNPTLLKTLISQLQLSQKKLCCDISLLDLIILRPDYINEADMFSILNFIKSLKHSFETIVQTIKCMGITLDEANDKELRTPIIGALENETELLAITSKIDHEMKTVFQIRAAQVSNDYPINLGILISKSSTIVSLYEYLKKNIGKLPDELTLNEIVDIYPEIFPDAFSFTIYDFTNVLSKWQNDRQLDNLHSSIIRKQLADLNNRLWRDVEDYSQLNSKERHSKRLRRI